MRAFKTRWFHKWAITEGLTDESLQAAVSEMNNGLIDADLGRHVFKKRVALLGRGKSGGARTLVALKKDDRVFFIYGFTKNNRANISDKELKILQRLAVELLGYSDRAIDQALSATELVEVIDNDRKHS